MRNSRQQSGARPLRIRHPYGPLRDRADVGVYRPRTACVTRVAPVAPHHIPSRAIAPSARRDAHGAYCDGFGQ